MLVEHRGKRPRVHETAYIAHTAVVCGDVTIGENSRVLFGATIVAEGGPVEIGAHCIIMENALIRGTPQHPTCMDRLTAPFGLCSRRSDTGGFELFQAVCQPQSQRRPVPGSSQ